MNKKRTGAILAVVFLAVTGMLMARLSGQTSGLFNFANTYGTILSIKHILVILITVIALIRSIAFKNAASSKDKSKKKMSMVLLMVNTFLGTVILILSSIITVIG